jgi:catechol 2,3-dioxygenase-like lactoylglutathione lyase family enzyme
VLKLKRLDHVGVVVDDLDSRARLLTEQLGLEPDGGQAREELRIAFFKSGDARVELIEPLTESGREARLAGRPTQIEHISFEVESLDETLLELAALGIEITAPPTVSAVSRSVWTVPATSGGIMFQFQQYV